MKCIRSTSRILKAFVGEIQDCEVTHINVSLKVEVPTFPKEDLITKLHRKGNLMLYLFAWSVM